MRRSHLPMFAARSGTDTVRWLLIFTGLVAGLSIALALFLAYRLVNPRPVTKSKE